MNLRTDIAKAIMRTFDNENIDYDPDMLHRAADEVIADLMSKLTGQHFKAVHHPTIVGPAKFESDGYIYE